MTADRLLSRLEAVRGSAPRWRARCPAHGSRTLSLSIRECDDGTVLLRCFAGCDARAVLESVGLRLVDLFPRRDPQTRRKFLNERRRRELEDMVQFERTIVAVAESDEAAGRLTREGARRAELARRRVAQAERALR